jgi:glutathione synthase/RimK-type ligase-like ATP-grasp enzyme
MPVLIVVNNPNDWPLNIPDVDVVSARAYLTEPLYSDMRKVKVFNLCRDYRYQSLGYYVSLLASARGHKPIPRITTIQDTKMPTVFRSLSDDVDELIQKSLAHIQSQKFVLSIYFGRNVAKRYDPLCSQLFKLFHAPLLRAHFTFKGGKWDVQNIGFISASEIPEAHRDFVVEAAKKYFAGRRAWVPRRVIPRYDLAILHDPNESDSPSNEGAIQRFIRAAEQMGMGAEVITKDDYSQLPEFDALFIRQTTQVNHYTYRFARRAAAEGLVVIDDPESILKCANKVYMAELLARYKVPTPKTLIVHRDNIGQVAGELGFPCVLKQPDSSFSKGVLLIDDQKQLESAVEEMLEESELLIAQAFVPTEFDWRIGIFEQRPLYACKYFMAKKHWQIVSRDENGHRRYGKVETLPVGLAPKKVVSTALKAANLIGNGLYGVDLKQCGKDCCVVEVNDNPNIDAGVEDAILKDELYERIIEGFLKRIERR